MNILYVLVVIIGFAITQVTARVVMRPWLQMIVQRVLPDSNMQILNKPFKSTWSYTSSDITADDLATLIQSSPRIEDVCCYGNRREFKDVILQSSTLRSLFLNNTAVEWLVLKTPRLTRLNLRGSQQLVSIRMEPSLVDGRLKIDVLSLADCPNIEAESVLFFAAHCRSLLVLDLTNCPHVDTPLVKEFILQNKGLLHVKLTVDSTVFEDIFQWVCDRSSSFHGLSAKVRRIYINGHCNYCHDD